MEPNDAVEVACTLTPGDASAQALEWADLGRLATTRVRVEQGVRLTLAGRHREAIEDLAARERACCGSWLDIELRDTGDTVVARLTSRSPDGVGVLEAMVGLG